MKEPLVVQRFADNGDHSHWEVINSEGEVILSEEKDSAMKAELEELNLLFDLCHQATLRGTELYRKIHPDYPVLTYPDTSKMIESLCDRIIELEKENERLNVKAKEAWFESVRNAKIANSRVLKGSTVRLTTWEQFAQKNNIK